VGKVPDSLMHEFKTKKGRKVFDGGGIAPDFTTEVPTYSSIAISIVNKYLIFDYATEYAMKHPTIASARDYKISDSEYEDFIKWLSGKEYDYVTDSERKLEDLKTKAEKEHYFDDIKADYEVLKKKLAHDKTADLRTHKEELVNLLENEIVSRYYYQNGRIENDFSSDPEIKVALKALEDPTVYTSIYNRTFKQ
jgi:carboxyl-terminal processing protease